MLIRLDNFGAFKRHHADYRFIRQMFQEIIKAARIKYCIKNSPETLHTVRLGQYQVFEVSRNQYSPYELFKKSHWLKDPKYDAYFMSAVQALWKKPGTNSMALRIELNKKFKNDKFGLNREKLIEILTWCVQNSPPSFQLDWISV